MPDSSGSCVRPFGLRGRLRKFAATRIFTAACPPALRLGSAFLQFAATVVIARRLGSDGSAAFFFWSAVIMSSAMIATFGLDRLALQQVPRLVGSPSAVGLFLGPVRAISAVLALLIGLLLIAYATLVQHDFGHPAWWYVLLPVCMVSLVLCKMNGEALKGLAHPLLSVHYRNLLPAGVFLGALLVFGERIGSDLALLCFTAGFAVAGFGALWGSAFSGLRPHFRWPTLEQARDYLGLGLPICVGAILSSLTYVVPLAILERCQPARDIAYFTTSYRVFVLFELLALAAYSIVMPQLSRAAHQADWRQAGKIYRSSIRQGIKLLAIPLLGATIMAGPLMSLFGEGFVEARAVLVVFLLFGLVSLVLGPADDLILMMGRMRRFAGYSALVFGLALALSLYIIPAYGPVGMAAIFGAGIVLKKLLCLWDFRRVSRAAVG